MPVDITKFGFSFEWQGEGIYNDKGVRVCSLHPKSLIEFVLQQGDYILLEKAEDYDDFLEYMGEKKSNSQLWTTPEEDLEDVVAPQIGTGSQNE